MKYKIEVHTKQGDPLVGYEVESYWISADDLLLHMKTHLGARHIIIPFSNILHFSAIIL